MPYRNGKLPATALVQIPWSGHRVITWALPGLIALNDAFHAEFGTNIYITDGYRTYAQQVQVKKNKGPLAATPGYSNHGWGEACDFGSGINSFSTRQHKWMRANAPRFGWDLPAWARPTGSKPEAWHWEALFRYIPPNAPPALPPELEPIKEVLMTGPTRIVDPREEKAYIADLSTGALVHIPNTEFDAIIGEVFDPESLDTNQRQFDVARDFLSRVRDNLRNG